MESRNEIRERKFGFVGKGWTWIDELAMDMEENRRRENGMVNAGEENSGDFMVFCLVFIWSFREELL